MNKQQYDHIRQLLDEVRIKSASMNEARKRYAARLAPDFHLFDYLRNDELGLSRHLALLLDPHGAHEQGKIFLQLFVSRLGKSADWVNDLLSCRVQAEKVIKDQRRIDIHLGFSNGVIGIENKPWAGEQPEQLRDYARALGNGPAAHNWLLVYLCNEDPSDYSISDHELQALKNNGHYCLVEFTVLSDWLDDCARMAKAPVVRLFLEELAVFVRRHVNGELEMTEVEEIRALVLSSDHSIDSAFRVAGSINPVKEALLSELKNGLISEMDALGGHMALIWDDNKLTPPGQGCAGFSIRLRSDYRFDLRFEFAQSGLNRLEWGICRGDEIKGRDEVRWKRISDVMSRRFGSGGMSNHWPWYSGDLDKVLPAGLQDWRFDPRPWLSIRDKSEAGLIRRIIDLAREVGALLVDISDELT